MRLYFRFSWPMPESAKTKIKYYFALKSSFADMFGISGWLVIYLDNWFCSLSLSCFLPEHAISGVSVWNRSCHILAAWLIFDVGIAVKETTSAVLDCYLHWTWRSNRERLGLQFTQSLFRTVDNLPPCIHWQTWQKIKLTKRPPFRIFSKSGFFVELKKIKWREVDPGKGMQTQENKKMAYKAPLAQVRLVLRATQLPVNYQNNKLKVWKVTI